MCNFCSCFGWILDILNKFITWILGCAMILAICLGFLVTLTAGVAYGYNYSIAEFMHIARMELDRFNRSQPNGSRGLFKTLRAGGTWRTPGDFPFQRRGDGAFKTEEDDEIEQSQMRRLNMTPHEMSKILANERESNYTDKYYNLKEEVRLPPKLAAPVDSASPGVFLQDLFSSKSPLTWPPHRSSFKPTVGPEDNNEDKSKLKPFMFSNLKDSNEEESETTTKSDLKAQKILEEKSKIKPFMLSNVKESQEEPEPPAKSKGALPDIPDYGEYIDDETLMKKPI